MNFDAVRNEAYRQAIESAVTSDSVVVDLGAGLGLLGFMAARAGARKVYLVEPEDVIQVTQSVAEANGLDNVECIQARAETLELPCKADLIVSVMTGNFLLAEDLLPALFTARDRFLAPGGRMLPDRGRMMVMPVSAAGYYRDQVKNWALGPTAEFTTQSYGVDYSVLRKFASNTLYNDTAKRMQAHSLASPACLMELDFTTATRAACDHSAAFTASGDGVCHGWLGWFDMRLGSKWLSTAPDAPETHWRQVFLPLEEPRTIHTGDTLRFGLHRPEYGDWTWNTEVGARRQRQSTFHAQPLSRSSMALRSNEYRPQSTPLGRAMQALLARADGSASVAELADFLMREHADCFTDRREALRFVKEQARKFG